MLDRFDDELVVVGDVEDAAARSRVDQLVQRVVAHRQLKVTQRSATAVAAYVVHRASI